MKFIARKTSELMDKRKLKSIVESLLFVNENPLSVAEIAKLLDVERGLIKEVIEELKNSYVERQAGIEIITVAGGYQMCSAKYNAEWVKKFYKDKFKQRLSNAALETLAIIAYRQPVTKLEIESIRGVNSDGVVRSLLEIGLIKISGRKEVIGRPFLYSTTKKFLEHFGLNSLRDLPDLNEGGVFSDGLKEITSANRQD